MDASTTPADKTALLARGRLKIAHKWFKQRGWKELPQSERGRRILRWIADHIWLANAGRNPKQAIRNRCRRLASWLTAAELEKLVADTETSNKRWSHDQCAAVLEINLSDRDSLSGARFIGADDDPLYERRQAAKKAQNAAANRRYRAKNSTGRPRGRPALQLSPEAKRELQRLQAAERQAVKRAANKSGRPRGRPKKCVTLKCVMQHKEYKLDHAIKRDGISVPTNTDAIDFRLFGIVAVRVMRGNHIVREWRGPPQ